MMRMKSLTPHEYNKVQLDVGDEFDCEDEHVQLLKSMQRAEVVAAPTQPPEQQSQYQTRDMAAAPAQPYHRKQLPRSAKGRTP